jgi:small-conductance mechanosensitive channel
VVDKITPENQSVENVTGRPPLDDPNLAIIAAIICAANIGLLLILLFAYVTSYKKLKSQFTLGLVIFATLLIVQNIMFMFFLLVREGFHGPGMGFPVLSLSIVEFGALLVLLKTTGI